MAILSDLGIQHSNVHVNLSSEALIQLSLETDKGSALSDTGALMVYSGEKTGRSPKDKRIVLEESSKEHINWGDVNQPIDPASFNQAKNNAIAFFNTCANLFVVDGYAVWDKKNRIKKATDKIADMFGTARHISDEQTLITAPENSRILKKICQITEVKTISFEPMPYYLEYQNS